MLCRPAPAEPRPRHGTGPFSLVSPKSPVIYLKNSEKSKFPFPFPKRKENSRDGTRPRFYSPKSHRIEFAGAARTEPELSPDRRQPHAVASHPIPRPAMKITALLVLRSPGDSSSSSSATGGGGGEQQAAVLANASDVTQFGFFQRPAAREFIVFVARTVALRTPARSRQSVQHEGTSFLPSPCRSRLCAILIS